MFFLPYSDMEGVLFKFVANFSGCALENCLLRVHKIFLGQKIWFWNCFNLLRHWAKTFCLFVKTFGRVVKTASFLSIRTLCRIFLKKKVIYKFFDFRTMSEQILSFCWSFSDGFVKTAFYAPIGTFSVDKILLEKCLFINCGHSTRTFWLIFEFLPTALW